MHFKGWRRISLARDYMVRERHSRQKKQHKQTFSGGGGGGKDQTKKSTGHMQETQDKFSRMSEIKVRYGIGGKVS